MVVLWTRVCVQVIENGGFAFLFASRGRCPETSRT